jgi:hypothetical protein
MKLRDRMAYSDPTMAQLVSRLDPLIDAQNLVLGSDLFGLLEDIAVQYEAHRILTAGTVHGLADSTNALVTVTKPTTRAAAVAMVNDIRAKMSAHMILIAGTVHGAVDTASAASVRAVNPDAGWEDIKGLANHLRSRYELHRARTIPAVHGAADATNVITHAVVVTEFIPTLDAEV